MSSNGKSRNERSRKGKTAPKYERAREPQVTPTHEFDFSTLVYAEPQKNEIPGGGGYYRRVRLSQIYPDGKIGQPMIQLAKRYSFGVQPNNLDKDGNVIQIDDGHGGKCGKKLTGYKVPIVMTSKEPTEEEEDEVDFFDSLRAEIQRWAVENKKAIGKGSKSDVYVEELVSEILFRKKDKKTEEVIEGVSPKLYVNLLYYHNKKEVQTEFWGPGDEKIDPLTQTNHFFIWPTIRLDSIYIGGRAISLQLRLYDATVEPISRGPRKRLAPPSALTLEEGSDGSENEDGAEGDVNDMMESDGEE